jgi:hypothetical protein
MSAIVPIRRQFDTRRNTLNHRAFAMSLSYEVVLWRSISTPGLSNSGHSISISIWHVEHWPNDDFGAS